ncbi:MAG: hypothetical protein MUC98_14330 [Desulfobacterota bacterium]|jgi:hypothetical protein|nr:hypothetical protein [Thermodesulfobacteriota bacterium]
MKALKTMMVVMIGLSLVLAASTALADGKYRRGGSSYGAYAHGKSVYVDRHVRGYAVAPRYAWGYYPAYPRVYAPPVYRGYCAPYAVPYAYAPAYRPGWSFGFSFGW